MTRPRQDAARRLVEHWYGGVDQNGKLIATTFDDSARCSGLAKRRGRAGSHPLVVGGTLTNPPNTEQLYHEVYAQHCRIVPHDHCRPRSTLRHLSKAHFSGRCAPANGVPHGVMPAARLTMDRFWAPFDGGPSPGAAFATHIANLRGETPAPAPGTPSAEVVGLELAPLRGDTVYLDGANSAFARSYAWSLIPPGGSRAALTDAGLALPRVHRRRAGQVRRDVDDQQRNGRSSPR